MYERSMLHKQPFLWAVAVHTCRLLSNFNQSSCNTETGQHSPLQGSCCPVSALQLLHVYVLHIEHVHEQWIIHEHTCIMYTLINLHAQCNVGQRAGMYMYLGVYTQ